MGSITPMSKGDPKDKIQMYLSPEDRAALNAMLEAIEPGLSKVRGEETRACLRAMRLGLAIYAGRPSMRNALAPEPGMLIRLVNEAKERDAAVTGPVDPPTPGPQPRPTSEPERSASGKRKRA
jgi:hypothetical protein